ncbi:hypothetical protein [Aliiglaciecola sp. LCG003]|uniref:hypothetical protein n=1 Tax=Aliiglaciecola sp. LCG003 TaxID=3053655 RepID=UPI00257275CA|nr:hypothetical protein [Aliiglaciecola sp. LCG003]WJG11204.1 hypothetical protein QR722_09305 [Aliiglaciecola sp. LCG003]
MKFKLLVVMTAVTLITGCADSVSFVQAATMEKVGFLHGLWHGCIFPISWLCSLFMDEVAIYAIYNDGGWYDFGFFLGLGGLSGIGLFRD